MKKMVSVLEKIVQQKLCWKNCSTEIGLEEMFNRNCVGKNVQLKLWWQTKKFLLIPHFDRQFPWLCVIIGLLG